MKINSLLTSIPVLKVYCETLQVMKINSLWNAKIVILLNLLAYSSFQDYSR